MFQIRIRQIFKVIILVISLSNFENTKAQEIDSVGREIYAIKTDISPEIDGVVSDAAWSKVIPLTEFIQREPDNGKPVSERTEIKIIYDRDNLYFGIKCFDSSPGEINASEMRRDQPLLNDDAVEIFLDTYNDHRNAFYFSTNPLGAQRDGIVQTNTDENFQNWDWNGVWECESRITDEGWTSEIKIPFKTLRFKNDVMQEWGLNISRIIPRKREETYWAPIDRDFGFWGKYRIDVYGHLKGISNITQPEKFQIKPFILTGMQGDFEEHEPSKFKFDGGLDAKYLLTSNITLDVTVNTDFAQVEADQEQVNLTRFELFFPEKREFFLEGASIFQFGEKAYNPLIPATQLFFSRSIGLTEDNEIVPIIGGLKMTGKAGGYDLGFMNVFTNNITHINDDDEEVYEPQTNYSVLRVKRDIMDNSYLGAIALNKESLENNNFNRTFGIDGNLFFSDRWQLGFFGAKSSSPEFKGDDLAYYGALNYVDDLFFLVVSQTSIQENFNPEMGFLPRSDIQRTEVNLALSPRPDFLNIRQATIFTDLQYYAKQNGELESRGFYNGIWNLFNNGSSLFFMHIHSYEKLDEDFEIHDDIIIPPEIYTFHQFYGEYVTDYSKPVAGTIGINAGEFFDGQIFGYDLKSTIRFNSQFTMEVQYNRNNITLPHGDFSTDLLGTRFIYTFTPKMYAKAFIQWNSDREVIIGNFLFNLIHTPGSDLYFVYNEELSTETGNLKSLNRTIILKLTYLLSI